MHYQALVRSTLRQKNERDNGGDESADITRKGKKQKSKTGAEDDVEEQSGNKVQLSVHDKYVRLVRKKLQAIEKLVELQKEGAVLDKQQLIKVATLDEVMHEMEEALAAAAK